MFVCVVLSVVGICIPRLNKSFHYIDIIWGMILGICHQWYGVSLQSVVWTYLTVKNVVTSVNLLKYWRVFENCDAIIITFRKYFHVKWFWQEIIPKRAVLFDEETPSQACKKYALVKAWNYED